MKNLIRNILRENDFDWVDDVEEPSELEYYVEYLRTKGFLLDFRIHHDGKWVLDIFRNEIIDVDNPDIRKFVDESVIFLDDEQVGVFNRNPDLDYFSLYELIKKINRTIKYGKNRAKSSKHKEENMLILNRLLSVTKEFIKIN